MGGFEKVPSGRDYWKEQEAKEKAFIENSLKNLKNMINNDPGITRQPRLEKGAAVFNYKYMGWDWEIVARKDINGKYSVRVKKLVRFPNGKEDWKTQKNGDKDTFNFDAKDKNTFNRYLGAALDRTIGKNRDRLPTTGGFVYNLLNSSEKFFDNNTKNNPSQIPSTISPQPGNKISQPRNKPSQPTSKSSSAKESIEINGRTNLRKKPIDLHYREKNKERRLEKPNYPENEKSVEGRITRCLRFASITDAVEDRYGIPRGLLMALMAQEGRGDPTVINLNGDGGAGLIHIQAINAAEYGMKTIQRFKGIGDERNQIDYKHGAKLKEAKGKTKNNLRKLSELDDRFNPIMGIDVSARFLMGDKGGKNAKTGDDWINVANRYAGRGMSDYGYSVLVFWTTINKIRGNKMPTFKDKEINKVINGKVSAYINKKWERTDLSIDRTKKAVENLRFTIDGARVSSQEYYRYLQGQWDNYGLSDYVKYNREHPYKK